MSSWIIIEREHGMDLAVGPYPTPEAAYRAMNNAPLIDLYCGEDCLECYVPDEFDPVDESGAIRSQYVGSYYIVDIDMDNPDHVGSE